MIKFGIIGSGKAAVLVGEAINEFSGSELVMVGSEDPGRGIITANKLGTKSGSYNDVFCNDGIDVIYVASLNHSHYENCLKSLENGKHVLCEKPFGLKFNESQDLFKLAGQKKLFMAEALWSHYLPSYSDLRKIINSNDFGEIQSCQIDFSFPSSKIHTPRLYDSRSGGGALLDVGPYALGLLNDFFGQPNQVTARSLFDSNGIDLTTFINFKYLNAEAQVILSIDSCSQQRATLNFKKGWIEIVPPFWKCQMIRYQTLSNFKIVEVPMENQFKSNYVYQIKNTCENILAKQYISDVVSPEKTLNSIKLLESIKQITQQD